MCITCVIVLIYKCLFVFFLPSSVILSIFHRDNIVSISMGPNNAIEVEKVKTIS